jgi:hypothetical protein
VRRPASTVRTAALVGAGVLAVHQLRYLLWYGQGSDAALHSHGHAYLGAAAPLVVAATVIALARFLSRTLRGANAGAPPRLIPLWLWLSASLVAIYSLQEWLEGALAHGHPGGVGGVLGHGGWLSLPLAAAVGLALAVALRGAAGAAELLRRPRSLRPRPPVAPAALRSPVSDLARHEPCLAAASPRAPPAAPA